MLPSFWIPVTYLQIVYILAFSRIFDKPLVVTSLKSLCGTTVASWTDLMGCFSKVHSILLWPKSGDLEVSCTLFLLLA